MFLSDAHDSHDDHLTVVDDHHQQYDDGKRMILDHESGQQ